VFSCGNVRTLTLVEKTVNFVRRNSLLSSISGHLTLSCRLSENHTSASRLYLLRVCCEFGDIASSIRTFGELASPKLISSLVAGVVMVEDNEDENVDVMSV